MQKRSSNNSGIDYFSSRRFIANKICSGQKKKTSFKNQDINSKNKSYSQSKLVNFYCNTTNNAIRSRNKSTKKYLFDQWKSRQNNLKFKKINSDITNRQSTSTCSRSSVEKYTTYVPKNNFKYDAKNRQETLFLNYKQFIILGLLGQGQTAKVFKVLQVNTGFILAIKVIKKQTILRHSKCFKQIIRQLKTTLFLNHPNIIKIYGIAVDSLSLYVMMQLATDSRLQTYIQKHPIFLDRSASVVIRQILDGLKAIHDNRIIHRDLKPQNIVTIFGTIKICDFGWATYLKARDLAETYCGTPLYFSPEILLGKQYDQKVDVWAVGVIAFELLLGKMPFNINQQSQLTKIITDEINYDFQQKMSKQYSLDSLIKINFLKSFLSKNPILRKNVKQLREMQFIKMYDKCQIVPELLN